MFFITLPIGLLVITFSIQSCILMPNAKNVNENILFGFEVTNLVLAAYWFIINAISTIGICASRVKAGRFAADLMVGLLTPALIIFCQFLAYQ
mmetsp:Transcript_21897/g.29304  ORF Transcript_21897/g.29304 Transcript_21897/m.29304 type:complete len:93 (+) Transcript_21897:1974-2252(+)